MDTPTHPQVLGNPSRLVGAAAAVKVLAAGGADLVHPVPADEERDDDCGDRVDPPQRGRDLIPECDHGNNYNYNSLLVCCG